MKIAILGGGVAGVSSAILLKQKGFDVTVYERHITPSNIGAGIVVWPNAAFILDQLGVLNEIKAVSGYPSSMRRLTSAGEFLGTLDIGQINRLMGYPSLSIFRKDFQNILIAKLESSGVAIAYGHTVTNIETNNAGQAEVFFQNGEQISADLIIGTDGRMASYARKYILGNNIPVYQGFINWVGVYESQVETFEEISVADYWGTGERFGIVPVTKYKAYWAGGSANNDITPKNPAAYQDELLALFSSWPKPIKQIIEGTPIEQINKIYVHDHNPISTWHKNNLIAIGDAAHASLPTSGQGACQALEDAWHLTNCLMQHSGNLQQAFAKFTEIRFEKTSGITMSGRSLATSLFNRDEKFCLTRNQASKNTDFTNVAAAMAKGWSQHLLLNM